MIRPALRSLLMKRRVDGRGLFAVHAALDQYGEGVVCGVGAVKSESATIRNG